MRRLSFQLRSAAPSSSRASHGISACAVPGDERAVERDLLTRTIRSLARDANLRNDPFVVKKQIHESAETGRSVPISSQSGETGSGVGQRSGHRLGSKRFGAISFCCRKNPGLAISIGRHSRFPQYQLARSGAAGTVTMSHDFRSGCSTNSLRDPLPIVDTTSRSSMAE